MFDKDVFQGSGLPALTCAGIREGTQSVKGDWTGPFHHTPQFSYIATSDSFTWCDLTTHHVTGCRVIPRVERKAAAVCCSSFNVKREKKGGGRGGVGNNPSRSDEADATELMANLCITLGPPQSVFEGGSAAVASRLHHGQMGSPPLAASIQPSRKDRCFPAWQRRTGRGLWSE